MSHGCYPRRAFEARRRCEFVAMHRRALDCSGIRRAVLSTTKRCSVVGLAICAAIKGAAHAAVVRGASGEVHDTCASVRARVMAS